MKGDKSKTKVIYSKKIPRLFTILDSKVSGDSLLILYKETRENKEERASKKKKRDKNKNNKDLGEG